MDKRKMIQHDNVNLEVNCQSSNQSSDQSSDNYKDISNNILHQSRKSNENENCEKLISNETRNPTDKSVVLLEGDFKTSNKIARIIHLDHALTLSTNHKIQLLEEQIMHNVNDKLLKDCERNKRQFENVLESCEDFSKCQRIMIEHNYVRMQKVSNCNLNTPINEQLINDVNVSEIRKGEIKNQTSTLNVRKQLSILYEHSYSRINEPNNIPQNDHSSLHNTTVEKNYIGRMDIICMHCKAKHFKQEKVLPRNSFDDCCNNDKINFQLVQEFPDELRNLFDGTHVKSKEFFANILRYNSSLSFASFNANVINFNHRRSGPYCFKIQGSIYYQINTSVTPHPDENPLYGQLLIYDGDEATKIRLNNNDLDFDLMKSLDSMMREHNIFAQSYIMMGEEIEKQLHTLDDNVIVSELHLAFTHKEGLDIIFKTI